MLRRAGRFEPRWVWVVVWHSTSASAECLRPRRAPHPKSPLCSIAPLFADVNDCVRGPGRGRLLSGEGSSGRLPVEDPNDVGESMRREATASRKWARQKMGPDKETSLERQMSECDSENVRRVVIAKFLAYNARSHGQSLARATSSERQLGQNPIFSNMLAF
jgi:hypothetical protein